MSRPPRLSVGGREGVGGRALKFLIMGNFKGGGGVWKKRRVFGLLIS